MSKRNPNLVKDKLAKRTYWLYNRYMFEGDGKEWSWKDMTNPDMDSKWGRTLNSCVYEAEEYHKHALAEEMHEERLWLS